MDTYNTKQKKIILDFLQKNSDVLFTCEDVHTLLREAGTPVGKTTVYRFLESFCKTGKIRKIKDNTQKSASYQYIDESLDCKSHLHLKCISCGRFIHLGCELVNSISNHISEHHSFKIDNSKTVIYGFCEACSGFQGE